MKITDLRIGDIVCNKRTKYPMKVVGIYEDGTVYLDFDGNDGDVFEENCKDLEFAKPRQKPEAVEYNKCFYNEGTGAHVLHISKGEACKSRSTSMQMLEVVRRNKMHDNNYDLWRAGMYNFKC